MPESMDKAMSDLNVKRLAGANRFDTNTEILKEVGVPSGETVLVCTGADFADCLSGSAVGKPIMLVYKKLTDAQKALVEGENADPDYFGRDTGDASADDPLNADGIGEKEILVVSFGTSFNDSRAKDIGGIEKALSLIYAFLRKYEGVVIPE